MFDVTLAHNYVFYIASVVAGKQRENDKSKDMDTARVCMYVCMYFVKIS